MIFNQERFIKAINEKMWYTKYHEQKRMGLREFSAQIGISTPTLSRILNKAWFDVITLLAICTWLDKEVTEFIDKA